MRTNTKQLQQMEAKRVQAPGQQPARMSRREALESALGRAQIKWNRADAVVEWLRSPWSSQVALDGMHHYEKLFTEFMENCERQADIEQVEATLYRAACDELRRQLATLDTAAE